MPYTDHFRATDDLVAHLNLVVPGIVYPALKSQYIGFLNVSVVTVFELCIKDLLVEFARKKNKSFGVYCANVFEKLNGRVSLKDLKEVHVKKFGEKYVTKFSSRLEVLEVDALRDRGVSLKSSYGNIIVWRNKFAHEGVLPANASYGETCSGYDAGKEIISCLAQAMVR